MFKKKKLYKITYKMLCTYTTIIAAKDEFQALRKFYRMTINCNASIISFEEYNMPT